MAKPLNSEEIKFINNAINGTVKVSESPEIIESIKGKVLGCFSELFHYFPKVSLNEDAVYYYKIRYISIMNDVIQQCINNKNE